MSDLLWVNQQIFYALASTHMHLAQGILMEAIDYYDTTGKLDLEPRLIHLANLLINDMNISLDLLSSYADSFLRLKTDLTNYSFLHSFLEQNFITRNKDIFEEKALPQEARKWVGEVIFKPDLVDYVMRANYDTLAGYCVTRHKLILLGEICEQGRGELMSVLGKAYGSVDALLVASEKKK